MAYEHIARGVEAHRAHQDAMADVSLQLAAQREAEAVAKAALLVPPSERPPTWVDPDPYEGLDSEHNAT